MSNRKEILHHIIIEKYKKVNPRVSLRAMAKRIGIGSGRLSEILNEKRPLTDLYLERFAHSLKLSAEDVSALREVQLQQVQGQKQKEEKGSASNFRNLFTPEQIELSIDWRSFAIMSLVQTSTYLKIASSFPSKKVQITKIANLMKLEAQEISSILQTMIQLNLITWSDHRLIPTNSSASTGYDIPNEFIKNAHRKGLKLAEQKLYSTDLYKRDFSTMMIAMNSKDIAKVKKLIRQFRRNLTTTLEKEEKTSVYTLSIQFFPIVDTDI